MGAGACGQYIPKSIKKRGNDIVKLFAFTLDTSAYDNNVKKYMYLYIAYLGQICLQENSNFNYFQPNSEIF